jgi:hypothetical protein
MSSPAGRCTVCRHPLGVEPHTITLHPDGEHLRCRDWSKEPWPYGRLVRQLRSRYRALRGALAAVEALGRWLSQRERRWPDDAADTVLEVQRRVDALRKALERAGFRGPSAP